MKTLGDAIHLRNRVIATLEEADNECALDDGGLLTVVVAGGGFAGVETLGALNDFVRDALESIPGCVNARFEWCSCTPAPRSCRSSARSLDRTREKLTDRGLEVLTGGRVVEVAPDGVRLVSGRFIPSKLVIWTAGTSPHPLLARLPCRCDRGRIVVDETLSVSEWPGVWAIGDCAAIPDSRTGQCFLPQLSTRSGRVQR